MKLLSLYEKWEKDRNLKFLVFCEYNPNAQVLDAGCGNGNFTISVKKKIGCDNIYGIDRWDEGICHSLRKGVIVIKGDLDEGLPFESEKFDVVVSNQVIEHLHNPSKFVTELHRILKVGGYGIISTENLSSWDNILALVLGYTPFSMQFEIKIGNPLSPNQKKKLPNYQPHVRIFSYQGLVDIMEHFGFNVERIAGSGSLPINFLSRIDPRHARFITVKVRKTKASTRPQ